MINKILNLEIQNFIWLRVMRKISRFFKIYFVPSNKNYLPTNNHPLMNLENFFENQLLKFKKKNFDLKIYKILKKNYKKNATIKFLDYGGENLDFYLFLRSKFPKIEIIVINQAKLNNYLKRVIKNKKIRGIKVLSNISLTKNSNFNFVHFGSSLQYLSNFEKILDLVLRKTSGYLYISATSFFYNKLNRKKLVVKQVNLLPVVMYCYIFNFNYYKKLLSNHKFKILSKNKNSYKKINFKNFEFKVDYLNILSKKNFKKYIYQSYR